MKTITYCNNYQTSVKTGTLVNEVLPQFNLDVDIDTEKITIDDHEYDLKDDKNNTEIDNQADGNNKNDLKINKNVVKY